MVIHAPISAPGDSIRALGVLRTVVEAVSSMEERWRDLLPELEVYPTTMRFRDIDDVKENYPEQIDDGEWEGVFMFGMSFADGVIKLYVGGDRCPKRQKLFNEVFAGFARIMWSNSTSLRQCSFEQAEALRFVGDEEEHFALFKEAFYKYENGSGRLWQESKGMYFYFRRLDFLRRIGHIVPDPQPLTGTVQ